MSESGEGTRNLLRNLGVRGSAGDREPRLSTGMAEIGRALPVQLGPRCFGSPEQHEQHKQERRQAGYHDIQLRIRETIGG